MTVQLRDERRWRRSRAQLCDGLGPRRDGERSIKRFRLWRSPLPHFPNTQFILPGDHSGGVPPVPIPNTEVKPSCADDTCRATGRENRSLPGRLFYVFYVSLYWDGSERLLVYVWMIRLSVSRSRPGPALQMVFLL